MNQICLFKVEDYIEERTESVESEKVRVRFDIPTYIKFYSIYQYDRLKFRELMNIWLKTDEGKNRTLETLKKTQAEILELCYKRDSDNKPLRDSDEKHIFRYKTLQRIYELIYNELGVNPFLTETFVQDGLRVHPDEKQAEINNSWTLPLGKRVKIHIRLLKKLRNENVNTKA